MVCRNFFAIEGASPLTSTQTHDWDSEIIASFKCKPFNSCCLRVVGGALLRH